MTFHVEFVSILRSYPAYDRPVDETFTAIARSITMDDKKAHKVVFVKMDLKSTRDSFIKVYPLHP